MANEFLRDKYGALIGSIETIGERQTLRSKHGALLGTFDGHDTRDAHGALVGHGNLLGMLIAKA